MLRVALLLVERFRVRRGTRLATTIANMSSDQIKSAVGKSGSALITRPFTVTTPGVSGSSTGRTRTKPSVDTYSRSGQAIGRSGLLRMAIEYRDSVLKFAVNPEDYTQSTPSRVTITQTLGGAWVDAWGAGLTSFTIKGTTGVGGNSTNKDVGYQRWRQLRDSINNVLNDAAAGEPVDEYIKFRNYTDNEYWYCFPDSGGLELYRSKSRPHMYSYTLHLIGIREIGQPATSTGFIGAPTKGLSHGYSRTTGYTEPVVKATIDQVSVHENQGDATRWATQSTVSSKDLGLLVNAADEYATNMEPIIGANRGRLIPYDANSVVAGLEVQSSGLVSNLDPFTGSDLADNGGISVLLSGCSFSPQVSVQAYDMIGRIHQLDPSIMDASQGNLVYGTPVQRVKDAITHGTGFTGTLMNVANIYHDRSVLTDQETNMVKMVVTDCMSVYLDLCSVRAHLDPKTMTSQVPIESIDNLIRNLDALALYFSYKVNDTFFLERLDVIPNIRSLQRTLIQARAEVARYL